MKTRRVLAIAGTYALARRLARRSGASDLDLNLQLPGDELIDDPLFVADRVATFDAAIDDVWPWIQQLGKGRGGWYMPHWLESLVVHGDAEKGLRHIEPAYQSLSIGDSVPDYGPGDPTFDVVQVDAPRVLLYRSVREKPVPNEMTWALVLSEISPRETKLHIRLRVQRNGPAQFKALWLPPLGVFDYATIAMVFGGLRERLREFA